MAPVGAAPEHRRHQRRPTDRPLLGAVILAVGVVWLLTEVGIRLSGEVVTAAALTAIGLWLVATSRRGGRKWPIVAGGLLTFALVGGWSVGGHHLGGLGNANYRPTSVTALAAGYHTGVGNVHVDLTAVSFPAGVTATSINVGVGNVDVLVPTGVGVQVTVNDGVGHAVVLGQEQGRGVGVNDTVSDPGYASDASKLVINIHVGIGNVAVDRGASPAGPAAGEGGGPPPLPDGQAVTAGGSG
ncbi:MAG TPA: LiaF domain-containing protein [Acidimicrobiales bacterium]|nr:LiaF domain-containing protein [Acidimicrobiales bacterium]